jgi:alanine-glyoxylate transaminase / serine-glyoxylate transaminase / serine-pyruvate transaminase
MTEIDAPSLREMPALMIAGPCELHDEDLALLGRQVIAHYGEVWTAIHARTIKQLSALLGAADPPYLIPGSGTSCLDAGIGNLFEPGQRVVVAQTGFFGTRLDQIARSHGLEVIPVEVETGHPISPERVAETARAADGILTTHVDTATGVRHPVDQIAEVARQNDCLYLVDGIASIGGENFDLDAMGVDAVVTSTQKGLEAPPGLGVLALGERARQRIEDRPQRPHGFYLDIKVWDRYREEWGAWHPHPVTMPTTMVLALSSSLGRILEAGVESWVAARTDLAKRCREGLRNIGLEPIPEPGAEANLVVAMWAEDPTSIQRSLLSEGIMISGGLDPTMGRAIRVGLMGKTATEEMVDRVVAGVDRALRNGGATG